MIIKIIKRLLTSTSSSSSSSACKKLYTPGPLSTTKSVKEAMMRDIGAGDVEFKRIIKWCKKSILELAQVNENTHEVVLMQGTGTYGIESVLQSTISQDKVSKNKILILENGFYAQRLDEICAKLRIDHDVAHFNVTAAINSNELRHYLNTSKNKLNIEYTHVALVHGETSSGVLNSIQEISNQIKEYYPQTILIVDSMCCFGAIELDLNKCSIDFLISSSNKCIQSVPGISFIICNKHTLHQLLKIREDKQLKLEFTSSRSSSFSLDLLSQYDFYAKHELFRLTPPTHVLLAFEQALNELKDEGGPLQRFKRISRNYSIIHDEMCLYGFKDFVPLATDHSRIVNCFYYPLNKKFKFDTFYTMLRENNKIIYSKSLTPLSLMPTFRIGNIGDLHDRDMYDLLNSIREILIKMNIYNELN